MSEIQSVRKACPYWSPDCKHLCTMTVSGLYVPLPGHILTFCRSLRWDQCPQYVRGCCALLKQDWTRGLMQEKGRRRHKRFSRRYPMAISDSDKQVVSGGSALEQSAWTLDLCAGGMRIETAAALPMIQKISFAFGEAFLFPGFAGLAEVCWQRPASTTGVYQLGLSFIAQIPFESAVASGA